jgi:serine/threonine protein kinase
VGVFTNLKKLFSGKPKSKLPIIDMSKRFELLGRTGQGSMSKVWRARDRDIGRVVCLKVLDKLKTAKFAARFPGLNRPLEGAICTALRHKNIVQTFEYGLTRQKEEYLVFELIDGMGLNFLIETRSPHLQGNRVALLRQIADAMEHIHQQSFLHRDVCPRNIMVTQEGLVKIIDFGLSSAGLATEPAHRTTWPPRSLNASPQTTASTCSPWE